MWARFVGSMKRRASTSVHADASAGVVVLPTHKRERTVQMAASGATTADGEASPPPGVGDLARGADSSLCTPVDSTQPSHRSVTDDGAAATVTAASTTSLDFFAPFPDDIWLAVIFPMLSMRDLCNLRLVCKAACQLATDDSIWQLLCARLSFAEPLLRQQHRLMPCVGAGYSGHTDDSTVVRVGGRRWWHVARMLSTLGETGRYALYAGFPETIVRGLGLQRRTDTGEWVRVGPPLPAVQETTLGIMTAERFIYELPRTPPQWIQAYTSVFNLCGNKHSRGSSLPDGCDWEAFQTVAYERVRVLMSQVMEHLVASLESVARSSCATDVSSTEMDVLREAIVDTACQLWQREVQPRIRMIQHIFARLARYISIFNIRGGTASGSLDKLPETLLREYLQRCECLPTDVLEDIHEALLHG